MTPIQRIDSALLRICNAAGVSMMHCTEEQLAVMREEMRQHLGTLRRLGRLKEGGFRGNFEVIT